MNSTTETQMLQIALKAIENNNDTVWEVLCMHNDEPVAVAAFSQIEFARLLALYLKPNGDPFDVDDTGEPVMEPVQRGRSETKLEIDKYRPELRAGRLPFDIQMYSDGTLFEAERADIVYEPTITSGISNLSAHNSPVVKQATVSGIFWAEDKSDAIEIAEQYVSGLNAQGAFH